MLKVFPTKYSNKINKQNHFIFLFLWLEMLHQTSFSLALNAETEVKWVSISSCFSGLPIHFFSDPLIVEGHTVQFESMELRRTTEMKRHS